jgi:hypothetical protein
VHFIPLAHGASGIFDEIILGAEGLLLFILIIAFFRSRGRKPQPPADASSSPLCPERRCFSAPRDQHRGHRMRAGDETVGLSPSGRILTGRVEGPASPPEAALGNRGIDLRTAAVSPRLEGVHAAGDCVPEESDPSETNKQ